MLPTTGVTISLPCTDQEERQGALELIQLTWLVRLLTMTLSLQPLFDKTMKILYPNPEGGVSVILPAGELPIADVAQKDVPAGTPYLIVEDNVIPSDRSFRNAWEADFSNPDGYGIGADAWFAQQEASE